MTTDKPKDNPVKPQQSFSNKSRIKAMFAAAEAELRKQLETKKV